MVYSKKLSRNNQNGSLLIEVIIASVILVLVGLSVLNSISTSNKQVSNTDIKANGLLALTAASEKLSSIPYAFCTSQSPMPNTYSSAVAAFNTSTGFNQSKISIANISIIETRNPSSPTYIASPTYIDCGDLSSFESVENFSKIQWNVQKIDLIFKQGNETLTRSIVKTFDGRNQSFANSGNLKVSFLPQASLAPANCPTTTSTSTNITLQIREQRQINLGLVLNNIPYTPSGSILYTISNADSSPTIVQATVSGSQLTVTAPEFKSGADALTRNPPGKLNIDVDALNLLTGEKALTTGIGITVNALKIVDATSNAILKQNDAISVQTAANASSPKINPTVVTGGCKTTTLNSGTYTYSSISSLPYGMRISSTSGEISGVVCLDSSDLYPTRTWGPFNYRVSDSNSPNSSATNSLYLRISTASGIAPLETLYISENKYGISISKSSSTTTSTYPIIKSCNRSLTGATYVAASAADGSGTVGLPSGITLNASGLNGKPATSITIGTSYTFYVKVTIGSQTYVTAEPIVLTVVA